MLITVSFCHHTSAPGIAVVSVSNMSSNIKSPPVFNPDEGDVYENWKSDVAIWQLFTKEEAKRQGPAVYLSLKGKARDAVRELQPADLNATDGVTKITTVLDKIYLPDESTRAYHAFKEFVEYRREGGTNYSNFIDEFETRYREVKRYKLELPVGVQAYFLLQSASLPSDLEKLARTTAKLEFDDMKDKLQKVFGNTNKVEDGEATPVKRRRLLLYKR